MALPGTLSVFLGWLLYFACLKAIANGAVGVNPTLWTKGVGACSLLLANGAMFFVQMQKGQPDWLVTLILWPLFMLPMDAGYRMACSRRAIPADKANED